MPVNPLKLLAVTFFFLSTNSLLSQKGFFTDKRVGIEISIPIGDYYQSNKAYGYSFALRGDKTISTTIALTMNIAINHYRGEMVFWDGQKAKDFTLVPLLIGVRKYLKPVYFSLEAGPAFALSSNAKGNLVFVPSVGKKIGQVDMSLRFFTSPFIAGSLTQKYLQRGEYNYIGFSVNYSLQKFKN